MSKKIGGTIQNWQLHHLTTSKKDKKLLKKRYPDILLNPGPMVFTGTVIYDLTGKWAKGFHMRSSLIVSIDRKNNIIETVNTIYNVIDEGEDVLPDMGNGVLKIFY